MVRKAYPPPYFEKTPRDLMFTVLQPAFMNPKTPQQADKRNAARSHLTGLMRYNLALIKTNLRQA